MRLAATRCLHERPAGSWKEPDFAFKHILAPLVTSPAGLHTLSRDILGRTSPAKRRDAYKHRLTSNITSQQEVIEMVKYDVLTGLLVGLVLGLAFTPTLAPHLATIVILAVIFGARMISFK